MKRILLWLMIVAQVLTISAPTANAADVTQQDKKGDFQAQNDILWWKKCAGGDSTSSATGSTISASTGGGGGCGDQGYSAGKRDSKANKDQIYSFFKGKGLSDTAIAGIMGNMESESAFMPDADNGNSGADGGGSGCRGVVQWCSGRNRALTDFAKQKGTDWSCLGTQLEFIWHEVTETGESGVMDPLNAAKTPTEAAVTWANKYERMKVSELPGRAPNAEKLYTEYTGQTATPLADSSSSASGDSSCSGSSSAAGSSTPGSLPSGECLELVGKIKQLQDQGKLILQNKAPEEEDINHCGQVVACPSSGHIGVDKHVLQVLIAMAEQSGQVVQIYALNKDHFCDKGEHGKGLGIDVSWPSSSPQGQAIYKFLFDNASSLGINKLIYNLPAAGDSACMYGGKPISCKATYGADLAGHASHIHVSL